MWVDFDCIFLFPLFRLVSGHLGRWVWTHMLRVYKVFAKIGRGPWLRGDSALGHRCNKLHSTICTVLLSEFVSREHMATTFGALAGEHLTLRRQVSFEATPRLCGLNLLEGGRHLAPLEEFSLSTPGFFALAGSKGN